MSKETKTTQENKPPEWATPLFQQSAGEASRLYNSGSGGNTYLGSTVAPLSDTTMQGVNQLANAGQAWDTSGTRDLFAGAGAAAVSPSYSETNLSDMASGKFLQEGNPFYRQRLEQDLADTAAQVRSTMSGMGRLGSGAETRELTNRLGNIRLQGLESDYDRAMSNMLTATGMMDTSRFAGLDRGMQAAGAMSDMDQRNFQNRLAGAQATLDAGGIVDRQAQSQLADEVAKFYALDNQDWTRLGMLQSAASGAAGPYGTQVATQRQPMNIGGLFSGLGSLMGKCDRRLKEDIILLGAVNGIPVYSFSYRDRPERYIGPMAQDLQIIRPEAVFADDDGYLAVDYREVGFPLLEVSQ